MASDFDIENALMAEQGYNTCKNICEVQRQQAYQREQDAIRLYNNQQQCCPRPAPGPSAEAIRLRRELEYARQAQRRVEADAIRMLEEQQQLLAQFMNVPRMQPVQQPLYPATPAPTSRAEPEGPSSPVEIDSEAEPIGEDFLKPVKGIVLDE